MMYCVTATYYIEAKTPEEARSVVDVYVGALPDAIRVREFELPPPVEEGEDA